MIQYLPSISSQIPINHSLPTFYTLPKYLPILIYPLPTISEIPINFFQFPTCKILSNPAQSSFIPYLRHLKSSLMSFRFLQTPPQSRSILTYPLPTSSFDDLFFFSFFVHSFASSPLINLGMRCAGSSLGGTLCLTTELGINPSGAHGQ